MAKKPPADLKASASVKRAMTVVFPPRVDDILAREQAVRENDIEAVHDMRVATKRLREAARVFRPAFGRARMERHLTHLESLNDTLGKARELDVMGRHLQALCERDPALSEGLRPLIDDVARRRQEADGQLIPALDETLQFLGADFAALVRDRGKRRADVWRMSFCELAGQVIARRMEQVLALEEAVRDPAAVAEFHRMRIAIKKARYALELCVGFCRRRAKKAHKVLSRLQETMGEAHDCDVLMDHLREVRGDQLVAETADAAMEMLAQDRAEHYRQTLKLLDRLHAGKIPRTLRRSLG